MMAKRRRLLRGREGRRWGGITPSYQPAAALYYTDVLLLGPSTPIGCPSNDVIETRVRFERRDVWDVKFELKKLLKVLRKYYLFHFPKIRQF